MSKRRAVAVAAEATSDWANSALRDVFVANVLRQWKPELKHNHLKVLVSLRLVCRQWCHWITDGWLAQYQTLTANMTRSPIVQLSTSQASLPPFNLNHLAHKLGSILRAMPQLTRLDMRYAHRIYDDDIRGLTLLRTLKLRACTQLSDRALKRLSHLTRLALKKQPYCSDAGLRASAQTLTRLSLSDDTNVRGNYLATNFPALRALKLTQGRHEDATHLQSLLTRMTSLRRLVFGTFSYMPQPRLCTILTSLPHLTELGLRRSETQQACEKCARCKMTCGACKYALLSAMLHLAPQLTYLELNDTDLIPAQMLREMVSLRELRLINMPFSYLCAVSDYTVPLQTLVVVGGTGPVANPLHSAHNVRKLIKMPTLRELTVKELTEIPGPAVREALAARAVPLQKCFIENQSEPKPEGTSESSSSDEEGDFVVLYVG
jgi:hypothetical protein